MYIGMTESRLGVHCMHYWPEAAGPHIYMYIGMTEWSLGVHCMHYWPETAGTHIYNMDNIASAVAKFIYDHIP